MKKSAALVVVVLLVLSFNVFAQRGGGGRRGGGGGGGARPSGGTDPNSMKDFNRAIALQATDEQRADFMSLVKSTDAARKMSADLAGAAANTPDRHQITDLKNTIDVTQDTQYHLLRSFSEVQKDGLKDFTKKLGKTNSAMLKALSAVEKNNKAIASSAEKLVQALSNLQTEQNKLGEEIGIAGTGKTAAN
ncbi:MAG: hypothetical protein JWO13_2450 [Acidobacteriales bacterium]|nr:hypothetical protein [Terriglobales bacterium]